MKIPTLKWFFKTSKAYVSNDRKFWLGLPKAFIRFYYLSIKDVLTYNKWRHNS